MSDEHPARSMMQRLVPWVVCALMVVYALLTMVRGPGESKSGYDYDAFGRIPVSAEGRTKPLDTVARNTLMRISGKQSLRDIEAFIPDGKRVEAIEWLAWLMAHNDVAAKVPVFRIDHPQVLAVIGVSETTRHRFSIEEIDSASEELSEQINQSLGVDPKQRDPYQRQIAGLYEHLLTYLSIMRFEAPYSIPPLGDGEEWMSAAQAMQTSPNHAGVGSMRKIMVAHSADDVEGFNAAVNDHLVMVRESNPRAVTRANIEVVFNRAKPFLNAAVMYIFGFLLACVSVLLACTQSRQEWSRSIGGAALGVIVVAFVVHTLGLGTRIYLQGRPPVTNLYSSAVFVGWGCVLLGICIERLFRLGMGSLVASAVGFATLVIAHNLSAGGDTMQMMQAVLDSNFWLATHVVVITIGYSATFLAGALAMMYILMGVVTPALDKERATALSKMVYGVLCFGALMSFVGTVLGGIWADQSWGRFWGWDPKENGAVLIVMMNLLILHARWGGMVKQRGVAVLAVGGNIITAWAWFGTNMLGVGLHSYGFTNSAAFWLIVFVASQMLVMAIGMLPQRVWMSDPKRASGSSSNKST